MKKILVLIMALLLCMSAFTSCSKNEDLEAAADYVFQMYKDAAESTPKDYDVIGKAPVGEKFYDVTWSVDVEEGVTVKESTKEGFYTIDVDEKSAKEIPYTLTATVTDEKGNKATKEFSRKVPAYKVNTYDEYVSAADDTALTVTGVITGIMAKSDKDSNNNVFVQDSNNAGAYYVFGLEQDPLTELKLKVGMTVEVAGTKTTYNGTVELKSAQITVVDSTIKTATPVDYTEIFKKADKADDAALVAKPALLVTIKGVEITGQDTGNGYYKFKLDGVESYVRISSSSNCTTKAEADTMKANHSANTGYTADVTGIVQVYNGAFYLIPVSADAFSNFKLGEKSPADQITHELNKVEKLIKSKYTKNAEIELPLKGADFAGVTFTYTVEGDCLAFDAATGKLTVNVEATDKAGKVTVVAKNAGATDVTKTFEVAIAEPSSILDALDKADGEKVTVSGIVVEIKDAWSEQYSNMGLVIMDAQGNQLYLYRTKLQAAVGDFVTVEGDMGTHSGERQLAQGSTGTIGTADADHKAAFELAQLKIQTTFNEDGVLNLPATGTKFADVAFEWTSEEATIEDGKITITREEAAKTFTVKVAVAGTDLEKEFKVVVASSNATAPISATITFDDVAKRTTFNNDQQVWVENGVTVTNDKAASTNNIADYAKPVRFYKSSNITVAFTANMTKIEFTCNTAAYATDLAASLTAANYTATADGKVVTLTLTEAAASVTCALTAQVRVDSITVHTI